MTTRPDEGTPPGSDLPAVVPPAPPAAAEVFGAQLDVVEQYAQLLATEATARGLIGPREVPRLWDRHLLNCAALTELISADARVVDVGTGAGLPGVVLALRRPDLRVDLVEPLLRRTVFLELAVDRLGLGDRVRIVRGRASDDTVRSTVGPAQFVVARAVAPLARLADWCLPLLATNGQLLAMKGVSGERELASFSSAAGASVAGRIVEIEVAGSPPVRVVVLSGRGRRRGVTA